MRKAEKGQNKRKNRIDDAIELRAKLERMGASFTRQRATVFQYLSGVNHHPTAEQVYFAVKKELPKIGLATVYKNLEALVTCGAASKLAYGDGPARYDIRTDHHYHSRCLRCGRITDLEASSDETGWAEKIERPKGFKVEEYRLEIIGICRGCQ